MRETVFAALGGDSGVLGLARAWHQRVMQDEVVSHAFSHGFNPAHIERLAAYWSEALGGATIYSDTYGNETTVVQMHSGNGPHEEMDDRAIACFDEALGDVGITDARLFQALHDCFAWSTKTTMSRFENVADVPADLEKPRWSWSGLVDGPRSREEKRPE